MKKFYLLILFVSFSVQVAFSQEKWEAVDGPFYNNGVADIYDIYARGDDVLLATQKDLFYSTNNGDSWSKLTTVNVNTIYKCYISSEGTFYILNNEGSDIYLRYSTDKGSSWQASGIAGGIVKDIYENSKGEIYLSIDGYLFKGSKSKWYGVEQLNDYLFHHYSLGIFALSKSDDFYIMSEKGFYLYNDVTGDLDTLVSEENLPDGATLYAAAALNSKDYIFVSSSDYSYVSKDKGRTWDSIFHTSQLDAVRYIYISENDEVFLIKKSNIYVSRDNGLSWTQSKNGFPKNGAEGVKAGAFALSDNGYAWCAVYNEKLYRTRLFTSVEEMSDNNLGILNAYPNPASDKISISLPNVFSGQAVNIEVYDISGVLRLKMDNATASEGNNIQLDVSALNSGMYYAVIKDRGNTIAEKFSVVK